MDTNYVLFAVVVMTIVTYLPRVLPLTLFRKQINSPFIKSFLHYIPYAVLGAMTFPGVFYATKHMSSSIIGVLVAVVTAYFGGNLLIVAILAVMAVLMVNLAI